MGKFILVLGMLAFTSCAWAYEGGSNDAGVKLDAPNLIKFSDDVSLGVEASKNFYSDSNKDWQYIGDQEGGFKGLVKLTLKWSILDFSK